MKKKGAAGSILASCLVMVFLFACDAQPKNPVAEYGDALTGAYRRGQQAGEIADLDGVRKTAAMYRATHGSYPPDLDTIKDLISANTDLSRYEYDPQNGSVTLRK